MSTGLKNPSESSGTAFAFVRPLPGRVRTDEGSSLPQPVAPPQQPTHTEDLASLLFPPKQPDGDALPPVTGLLLGHFVIEERIGRGGMGAVFRAIDQRLNRVVALKVLTPQQSQDPAAVQRFRNEARAAAQLDHDHISRVHYVGEDRGLHFIAFEFVSGANVRDVILQRGRLTPHDAVNYTLQIAEALRHTAAQNVVHRDIKPSNIILSAVGRVKLVDLGLARQVRPDHRESEDLTLAGTALGTFDYISPEQAIDARNVDVRSDIYSLGCTMYHMLTGEPPYPRGSMFEKVMNHHRPKAPDPTLKNRSVNKRLSRIVQRMMAANPDDRYGSPDELIADLALVADELGLVPAPIDTYAWGAISAGARPYAWDGTKIWLGLVALLLLAALLLDRTPWLGTAATTASTGLSEAPAFEPPTQPKPRLNDSQTASSSAAGGVNVVAPAVPNGLSSSILRPGAIQPDADPAGVAAALAAWELKNQIAERSTAPQLGPQPDSSQTFVSSTLTLPETTLSLPTSENLNTAVAAVSRTTPETIPPPPAIFEPLVATPAMATPGTAAPAPTALNPQVAQPFALIDEQGQRKEFATLYAAVANAQDNAVIELQYAGRAAGPQDPIKITGKRGIRIRPAAALRPILEFRLKQGGSTPLNSSIRMISLVNAGVEFYDIDLELWTTTQAVVDRWSLLSASGSCDLALKGCSCTVVNPALLTASLVELPQRESADLTQMMKEQMKLPGFTLHLEDCVLRGQANLVSQQHNHPSSISLQNVAVALSGQLVDLDGGEVVSGPPDGNEQEQVELYLDHVTAVLGAGLIRATSGDFGKLPAIQVDCRDSLISLLDPERPLVEFSGHEELDELAERLQWVGRREPNFFELLGPLWSINAPESLDLETSRQMNFIEWNAWWNETGDELVRSGLFRNPRIGPADKFDHIVANDFVLRPDDVTPNPAIGATSDRRDCGVDWSLFRIPHDLPTIPGR